MAVKRVLFVFPTSWDRKQLESCRSGWEDHYEITMGEPSDEECPWDFDVVRYIERTAAERRGAIDGVVSSSDYPGATAAGAIATRLGLRGSDPETLIRCSHKYYSRLAQREAVPEATPGFRLIDPDDPETAIADLSFPCFIKPVKGAFSILSRKLSDADELRVFLARPAVREFLDDYLHIFHRLVRELTSLEFGGRYFLAEELLGGTLATVEGWCRGDEVEMLGIVDSVVHPATGSFLRFDYPSSLDDPVQARMTEIARRAIAGLGLRDTLFNIEMVHDPTTGRVAIIEVNPRLCGQFADLYRKVDGTSGYEIALALATGGRPAIRRGAGAYATASSFPLRTFEPVRVTRAPDEDAVRSAESLFPETLIWTECQAGQTLSDFERVEDGASARYGIVNVGGADRDDVQQRFERVRERLGYQLVPVEP